MRSLKLTLALLSTLTLSSQVMGNDFEYTVDAAARSYSAGLSVTPSVAYKFSLWGEEKSPFEGSLKPRFIVDASPATYSGKAELEFSPVMFVNFLVGRKLQRVYSTFDDDSCRNNSCVGSLNSTDVGVRVLFKVGPIMGSVKYTKAFYDEKDDKRYNMVDPSTYTLLSPNKEITDSIEAIAGTPITDSWFTGVLIQNVELQKNNGNQNGQYLMLMKKNGHTSYIAGAGRFEADLKEAKPSFLATFKYDWQ